MPAQSTRQTRPAPTFVVRGSPEWNRMWSAIPNPDEGEGWQYMGTWGGVHEFRNRYLHGARVYFQVAAETGELLRVTKHDYREVQP